MENELTSDKTAFAAGTTLDQDGGNPHAVFKDAFKF
jgi:hypothetical protein